MMIRNLLTILAACTLALTSCSRHSAAVTKQTDLGTVEVFNGKTAQYDLGNGLSCTMTSTVSSNGTIVLQMEVKKGGEVISRPRMQTTSGVGVGMQFGDLNIALTPVIK